jgi:DNA-binding response OmpR family regulator
MVAKKILLIDDEEIIRMSLQQDLQDEGYKVDIAENGEPALAMLSNHYDLIITDLMMERVDGITVLEKAREANPQQAVFILTGYGELDSAINALRLGATDYLLKPYNYDELMLRIKNCLANQELRKKITFYEKILPVCCDCRKIRDDDGCKPGEGEWLTMEQYFHLKMDIKSSHGYCPECYQKEIAAIEKLGKLP